MHKHHDQICDDIFCEHFQRESGVRPVAAEVTPGMIIDALNVERNQLIVALTEIARWATANLHPEHIRDTPIDAYRVAGVLLDSATGHPDRDLANALHHIFEERAQLAEEWIRRRIEREAAGIRPTPKVDQTTADASAVQAGAAYSRKVLKNDGAFAEGRNPWTGEQRQEFGVRGSLKTLARWGLKRVEKLIG